MRDVLAEVLNSASKIINEMVITEDRDERYKLAVAFKQLRQSMNEGQELELFPTERRNNGYTSFSRTEWLKIQ